MNDRARAPLRTAGLICAFALVASGCTRDGRDARSKSTPSAVPVISIGECQVARGAQKPTAARGVDFRTQLREPGMLTIGSDAPASSPGKADPTTGIPAGFEIDLYTEIAERLNLKTDVVPAPAKRLLARSIPRGAVDVGISALLMDKSSARTVDFTAPYFQADLSVIVDTAKTPEIKSVDDLTGKTAGVGEGMLSERCTAFLARLGIESKPYPDPASALRDLVAGHVTAVVGNHPALEALVDETPALRVIQVIETRAQYGIAVSKRKPDLRVAVQGALTAIMNDGTYDRIYEKRFGSKPPFAVPIQ
jgi:polar amino acid transport system substrate-binding protein